MNGKRLTLFIVGGVVVALLLVWGGVLLGLSPGVRDTLRGLLPSGVVGNAQDYRLQQEILDKLESKYYEPIDEDALEESAIDGMVAGLDDPYTVYMEPDEYARYLEVLEASYTGVGIAVDMNEGAVTVVSTFKGSPAAEAGIEPGDIIVEVNGVPTEGMNLDEVVNSIKGAEGSSVDLTIYRLPASATTTTTTTAAEGGEEPNPDEKAVGASELPPGGKTTDYTLTRKTIDIPAAETQMLTTDGKKVALISFYLFSDGSAKELREQVDKAIKTEDADAIILDLRGNTGGLVDEAVDVASIFIEQGEIVSTEGLNSPKETLEATGGAYPDIPLYVLIDEGTASASEIVSGALQDYDRATLLGDTSFGKGLVQVITGLSDGGALKLTIAEYFTPDGRNINEKGIEPDVVAPDNPDTPDVDETVDAALDLISGTPSAAR